ncbi:MAG: Radical domain protein [Actinobacteria bacterium]|nr:Radical domain protein [Actinomycetota bacterium]
MFDGSAPRSPAGSGGERAFPHGIEMTSETMICKHRNGPVVLVSRPIGFTFPLSYAYLAGYLREKHEDVRVLFKPGRKHIPALVKEIMALDPLIVGFGNLYPELKEIGEIIGMLDKAGRRFPIVIGGQMVSPIPEFAVTVTGADFGVIGEGEIVLWELVKALRDGRDPSTVKGLAIRQGNQVLLTGPGEYIQDLSILPSIPYDLFPEEKWLMIGRWYAENAFQPHWRLKDRVINIHGGRGCPFTCNFCYHHSKPRYRPVPLMMQEAAEALERFNGNMLYFSDDLVMASPNRARQLVEGIRSLNRPVEYSMSARFDILHKIDDGLLQELKNSGCRTMGLGVESGSDRMLKVIGKNVTADMMKFDLERLRKTGILPSVSIMVGQHTETMEDVEASMDFVRETVRDNPNINYAFTITTPFPGTALYNLIMKNGHLRDHKEFYDRYFAGRSEWNQIVNLSEMSPEQVAFSHKKILEIYNEEKRKKLKRAVIVLEKSQGILNRAVYILRKYRITRMIPEKLDSSYSFILAGLEKHRLRLRGIG